MINRMNAIIRENDTCVLATVTGEKPHCSLMSYATDADCREIYMLTKKQTRKFINLSANPSISLLIDTRTRDNSLSGERISALTVYGTYQKTDDEGRRKEIVRLLLQRHPALQTFFDDPDAEVIVIRILSMQLLDGIKDSFYLTLSP